MIRFKVPQYILQECETLVNQGTIRNNEYKKGQLRKTNLTGQICESTVHQLYGMDIDKVSFGNDLVLDNIYDIKGQNHNAGTPNGNWWVNYSVRQATLDSLKQETHLFFTLYNHNSKTISLCGTISKDDFNSNCIFVAKGDKLPNGFPATVDTYTIQIKDLDTVEWSDFDPTWKFRHNIKLK